MSTNTSSPEKLDPSSFEWIGQDTTASEAITRPSTSYWKDAMRRLFKNKVAVVCLSILVLIILGAVFIPIFSSFDPSEQHVAYNYAKPFTKLPDGRMYLFGADILGRDLFVRMWDGARISIYIAFAAVLVNFLVGVVYGGISGYFGGAIDNVLMRIVEIINGIPYLLVVILLMMIMKPGVNTIVLAYGMVGWTNLARLIRGQIVQLKEQEFVIAAKSMGARAFRVIARHLLPNTLSVVIVSLTLSIPNAIFTEAFLSFIGLGVPVPVSSWGTLASDGASVLRQFPLVLVIPAFFISITMLSFNMLGDALRDAFDPKLRR